MPICPHCLMAIVLFLFGLPGIGFLIQAGLRRLGWGLRDGCKGNCDLMSTQVCELCEHQPADFGDFLCDDCLEQMSLDYSGNPVSEDQDTLCLGS